MHHHSEYTQKVASLVWIVEVGHNRHGCARDADQYALRGQILAQK